MLKVAPNPAAQESMVQSVEGILRALDGPKSLNLFPTENRMSIAALKAMASDAGRRYQFSVGEDCFYGDTGILDQVIKDCEAAAREFFTAKHAFVDGLSGLNTMHWVLTSFARRGSLVAIMDPLCGGHYATERICRDFEYPTVFVPFIRKTCEINYDAFADLCADRRPDIVYLDISTLVKLPSIPKVREAAGPNAVICFDASQVLALVPNHLDRIGPSAGLDVLNGSTHKTLPGPQKGLALTDSERIARKLSERLPYVVSNMHVNATGALAITFLEMMQIRKKYAQAIEHNSKALAESLSRRGLTVPGSEFGFTETQQVWIEADNATEAISWGYALRDGNIRSTVVPLPSNSLPGLRLGVQEITRVGMDVSAMDDVASIIADCVTLKDDNRKTQSRVAELIEAFQDIHFIA